MKRPARVPSQLSESLHKWLNAYALAATASGVSLLALRPAAEYALPAGAAIAATLFSAQSVEAKITYTPANTVIECSHTSYRRVLFPLDLNHDGVADFNISCWQSPDGGAVGIGPVGSENKVWVTFGYAGALHPGRVVRRDQHFQHTYRNRTDFRMVDWYVAQGHSYSRGPWGDVTNRYVGLRFKINQDVHFGWARLHTKLGKRAAFLTGYAYETIPNKPIIAGKTHGRDEATLGHLATGASAIPAWRVKPTAATTH